MRQTWMGRLTLGIACAALFAALGGPSYASSVFAKITGSQIANNAITSSKVKDGSLLARDFKTGQLPAGATGATGPSLFAIVYGGTSPYFEVSKAGFTSVGHISTGVYCLYGHGRGVAGVVGLVRSGNGSAVGYAVYDPYGLECPIASGDAVAVLTFDTANALTDALSFDIAVP